MRCPSIVFPLYCVVILTSSASAQVLRGRVTDASTGTAILAASLSLLGPDNSVIATALADDSGHYALRGQHSGEYRLKVERIGYATRITQPMQLSEGSSYNLPMQLAPAAVPIAPVTVKAEPRVLALENSGYYARKRMGTGTFIDRTVIDKREGIVTSELFRGVPGARLIPRAGRHSYQVFLRGGINARIAGRFNYCPALVWVDGVPVNPPGESYNFELIHPNDIEAIEVYSSPSQLPAQYNSANSMCGVILLWRRVGGKG